MREADYILDIGPVAGRNGGYLVAEGTIDEIMKNENSISLEIKTSESKIDNLNEKVKNIDEITKIRKIQKNNYFTVFFVEKKDKGEFIGKRGKNIRKLKKIFGDIVVKEI